MRASGFCAHGVRLGSPYCGDCALERQSVRRSYYEGSQRCRWHGEVDDDHFPCRAPGETAGQFTARAFGETRDA